MTRARKKAISRGTAGSTFEAPPKWSKRQIEQVEDWITGGVSGSTRTEWLALPKKERFRRTLLGLQSIYRDEAGKIDRELESLDRKRRQLDRDIFSNSWKRAQEHVSFLAEEIDDKLDEAKELTDSTKREVPATEEQAQNISRVMAELDDLIELRDLVEAAMASAAREATQKLNPALEKWDSYSNWAAARELAAAWPKDASPSDEYLTSLATRLLIDAEKVRASVELHAWVRAADGPMKAALNVIGDLVEKDPRTIQRGAPPANVGEIFRRLARVVVESRPNEKNLFGLVQSYFEQRK